MPPDALDMVATALDDVGYAMLTPAEWVGVGELVAAVAAAVRRDDAGAVREIASRIRTYVGTRVEPVRPKDAEATDDTDGVVPAPEPLLERIGTLVTLIRPGSRHGG
ncbi:MAG TPA: CATRA system-associated protein [Pseudonocardiaceae bacterium]